MDDINSEETTVRPEQDAEQSNKPASNVDTNDAPASGEPVAPMSKNQLKKQKRMETRQANKLQRRQEERQRQKENKRKRKENGEELPPKKRVVAPSKRESWPGSIAIELAWDDKMTDKEIISMTRQIYDCYGQARVSTKPIPIQCIAFNSRCRTRMEDAMHSQHASWPSDLVEFHPETLEQRILSGSVAKEEIVYLTADSPNILSTLAKGKTYVIGGIVDRNRYKNLCLEHAERLGVTHAQLPIGQYVQNMSSRKVLTVNHVYNILMNWVDNQDWEDAFYKPQRKFDKVGDVDNTDQANIDAEDRNEGSAGGGDDVGQSDERVPEDKQTSLAEVGHV